MLQKFSFAITEITMYKNVTNISQYYCFHGIFDQINAALVSTKSFQKNSNKKNLTDPKLLSGSV